VVVVGMYILKVVVAVVVAGMANKVVFDHF